MNYHDKIILIDRCYLELDTQYLGHIIEKIENEISLAECCNSCLSNRKCQSWTYNLINNTCFLLESFRMEYFSINGSVSGFTRPQCNYFII
jgi:hypothetical protein